MLTRKTAIQRSALRILLCLAALLLLSSCATYSYRLSSTNCKTNPIPVYPASAWDVGIVGFFATEGSNGFEPIRIPIVAGVGILALMDLPFSIITDTLLLPYDLYSLSAKKRNMFLCTEQGKTGESHEVPALKRPESDENK